MSPIVAIRGTIAAGMFFLPRLVGWVLGFRDVDPERAYLFRIWGARNIALAYVTAKQPKETTAMNVAVDLSDLAAGALLLRGRGGNPLTATAVLGLPALAAAVKLKSSGEPAAQ